MLSPRWEPDGPPRGTTDAKGGAMGSLQRDFAWRIGGPQGSGVDTAAGLFARACAIGGLHVFGRREYYSNIIGRHSYYDVRVAPQALTCHRERVDLMLTFEAESLARH